jgi:hypothetical protein
MPNMATFRVSCWVLKYISSNVFKRAQLSMGKVYLLNSPVLPEFGRYEFEGPVSEARARLIVAGGFFSAIGHEGSALFLSEILGQHVAFNRQQVMLLPGDQALVLRLQQRLPEGRILSFSELSTLPYELGLLSRSY